MSLLNECFQIYERNNKYLLIFPDIPYWMVTSKGGLEVIKMLKFSNEENDVYTEFRKKFGDKSNVKIIKKYIDNFKGIKQKKDKYLNTKKNNYRIDLCEIALTKECNLSCQSCYKMYGADNQKRVLDKEKIREILNQISCYANEECRIGFVGGEPLLYWETLIDSINIARELGFKHIFLDSNAILIDNYKAKVLADLEIESVTIVLDGITEETHELTRPKKSFDKIINGMRILRDAGITVVVRMAVHEKNFFEVDDFLLFCKEEKVYPSITPLAPIGKANYLKLEPVVPSKIVLKIKNALENGMITPSMTNFTSLQLFYNSLNKLTCKKICNLGKSEVFIDSNGDVYPCSDSVCSEYFMLGNIYDSNMNFSSIWENSTKLREIRELSVDNFPKCKNCDIKYICGGHCRAMTYEKTGNICSPFIWCKDLHDLYIDMMWTIANEKVNNLKGGM